MLYLCLLIREPGVHWHSHALANQATPAASYRGQLADPAGCAQQLVGQAAAQHGEPVQGRDNRHVRLFRWQICCIATCPCKISLSCLQDGTPRKWYHGVKASAQPGLWDAFVEVYQPGLGRSKVVVGQHWSQAVAAFLADQGRAQLIPMYALDQMKTNFDQDTLEQVSLWGFIHSKNKPLC